MSLVFCGFLLFDEEGTIFDTQYGEDCFFDLKHLKHSPGKHLADVFPLAVQMEILKAANRAKEDSSGVKIVISFPGNWGDRTYESCITPISSKAPLDRDLFLMLMRDITTETRMESMALSVNWMNSLGAVFSGIRHEIGNPINSIKLTLDLLKGAIGRDSSQTVQTYLNRLDGEIERIEFLLRSLKSFNSHEQVTLQTFSLTTFLDKFKPLVEKECQTRNILLDFIVRGDPYADADPRALCQILINLIENAMAAVEYNTYKNIVISVHELSGRPQVIVRDNGIGMDKSTLERLYTPFYTTKKGGTGLGLVLVKKLLIKMSATIDITSKVKEGTSATLTLLPKRVP